MKIINYNEKLSENIILFENSYRIGVYFFCLVLKGWFYFENVNGVKS